MIPTTIYDMIVKAKLKRLSKDQWLSGVGLGDE